MFDYLFFAALAVFGVGSIFKISTWFTKNIGIVGKGPTAAERISSAFKFAAGVICSKQIRMLLKALLVDVLLQRRIFKQSPARWLAHLLIFYGFMLLVLMHALEGLVSEALFNDYYPTRNPFFFLRDFLGAMVLAGTMIAACRRYLAKPQHLRTNRMDHYAIAIVAVIMLSGMTLEGLKISAYSEFQRMVEDYAGMEDEEEINALEALWVRDHGTVSPNIQGPFDEDLIEAGLEAHVNNCADCHASAKWAFNGFAIAKTIRPVALWLDQADSITLCWYLHIMACLAGLAYLPFSKMFHMIATPLALLANAVMDSAKSMPPNIQTRQIMELDACTHCGSCNLNCSAATLYEAIGNEYILPSEKMALLGKLASGKHLDQIQLKAIQEGVYLCTNCDRCTVHCPSGIRLKELWYGVREELLARGPALPHVLTPYSFARALMIRKIRSADEYMHPIQIAHQALAGRIDQLQPDSEIVLNAQSRAGCQPSINDNTYSRCFNCQSCTTVCPVVSTYDVPEQILGLLPHQIMCCLGLGLTRLASGVRMIWDCLTCYQCQENCPQQVDVCDVLIQLKNIAVKNMGATKGPLGL